MTLTNEQLKSFGKELDALRAEYAAQIGDADAEYIRSVRAVARILRVAGRLLIQFSLEPVSWGAGVVALGAYKSLENMEIGHNVLHGQYNFMHDPELNSTDYEWDIVATAKSWKRTHNATHHVLTNVVGRDGDLGFHVLRVSEDVPWNPVHLFQPLLSPLSGLFFDYSVASYDLGLVHHLLPGRLMTAAAGAARPLKDVAHDVWSLVKKVSAKNSVEYVLYPALAGAFAPKVIAGNALANLLRNVWAWAVIYCGHFPEEDATFRAEDLAAEDRPRWYARQVQGTSNFELSRLGHLMSGHLGFQIEHHLFPNMPAWRYPAMAPRVREICERHGIPYHTGPLRAQFASAMRRVFRLALPSGSSGSRKTRAETVSQSPRGSTQRRQREAHG
ncbi:MAG TPA: acyl-CoA desaturase, partial [Myxococcaceae bacterium]|nr:acyl-CoA desaturase [Myxococcaceae bacterium]